MPEEPTLPDDDDPIVERWESAKHLKYIKMLHPIINKSISGYKMEVKAVVLISKRAIRLQ